jgi:hypothetical protein
MMGSRVPAGAGARYQMRTPDCFDQPFDVEQPGERAPLKPPPEWAKRPPPPAPPRGAGSAACLLVTTLLLIIIGLLDGRRRVVRPLCALWAATSRPHA